MRTMQGVWRCDFYFATLFMASGQFGDPPTQSTHRHGPHGLEGWTLNDTVSGHGDERFPHQLVIARHGKVVRRIESGAFVWKWMFLPDGKHVAYESGPFHFVLTCELAEIRTDKVIADYDCEDTLDNAPQWVKDLENDRRGWD
ncbi:MAG: hypothetical protein M3R43_09370 [Acidobacteriota bacterium]|nr:hypothetical protein [Acidobacteriota bacterium]